MDLDRITIGISLLISVLLAADIFDDLSHGADLSHVALEAGAVVLCSVVIGMRAFSLTSEWKDQRRTLEQELASTKGQRDEWRAKAREHLRGLSSVIDEQFEKWKLSQTEKMIGLLMLKGLSHKEIAGLRNSSERTVRQQASSLYSKAGLDGKGHLAAFFLEDLLLPAKLPESSDRMHEMQDARTTERH